MLIASTIAWAIFLIAAARLLCFYGLASIPWLHGSSWTLLLGVFPIEALFTVLGACMVAGLLGQRPIWKAMPAVVLGCGVVVFGASLWIPDLKEVLLWRGEDGEFLQELAIERTHRLGTMSTHVKPDGDPVWLRNNPNAANPTWAELVAFLQSDLTDSIPYQDEKFVCANYAEEVHNNAEFAGIRCAFVTVDVNGKGHALNAFRTRDRGLIFIDCTGSKSTGNTSAAGDATVDLNEGEEYRPLSILRPDQILYSTLGIAQHIRIFW